MLLCLGVLSTAAMTAQERSESMRDHVMDSLPAFDPGFAEKQQQMEAAAVEAAAEEASPPPGQAPRPRLRSIPPLVRKSNQAILAGEAPALAAGPPAEPGVVELPEMTVETRRLPGFILPRLPVERPKKNVKLEPFLTPEARAQKLIEKHLSGFDRLVLNRFELLGSNAARALAAERREQYAQAMNELAEAIEQASIWGVSEEEKAKLREEYYQLLVNRPR